MGAHALGDEPRRLVTLARVGRGDYRARIVSLVPCAADRAWARLRRLDDLHLLIPFCEHSTTQVIDENQCELSIRIGLPAPFPRIHYRVHCELDEASRRVRWWRLAGNLSRNDGSLGFEPIDAESCRARYECTVGMGFHVPRVAEGVLRRAILPRVIRRLVRNLARP